jgi:hypothetical protein
MSRILLTLLGIVAAVSASTSVYQSEQDWSPNGMNITEFRYYFTAMRASFEGGLQGLYGDDSITVDRDCMNEDVFKEVVSIETLISSGDILGLVRSSGKIFKVFYDFDKTCDLNELFFTMGQWAFKNGTNIDEINNNFKNNLFALTGAVNEIAQVFFGKDHNIDWTDLDKC